LIKFCFIDRQNDELLALQTLILTFLE